MNKAIKIITVILMMFFGSSCEKNVRSLVELNASEPIGSPFNSRLAIEYNRLARNFGNDYLARKGLAANDGIIVMPETVENFRWQKNERDVIEKTEARAKLINALSTFGREQAPEISAVAQAYFDCWVLGLRSDNKRVQLKHRLMEQEWNSDFSCRLKFAQSFAKLQQALNQPNKNLKAPITPRPYMFPSVTSVADDILNGNGGRKYGDSSKGRNGMICDKDGRNCHKVGEAGDLSGRGKGPLASINEAMFITFFEWNRADITRDSSKVIAAVAKEIKQRNDIRKIVLVGHADTSGSETYNQNLSVERAINVSDTLIRMGINRKLIKAEGRGEKELRVKTPDNVREPANRRVEISFE